MRKHHGHPRQPPVAFCQREPEFPATAMMVFLTLSVIRFMTIPPQRKSHVKGCKLCCSISMLPDDSRAMGPRLSALGEPNASLAARTRSFLQHSVC